MKTGDGELYESLRRAAYPFTAIVDMEDAKKALLAVAVNPLIGGVLLRGDKGTGKTTLVRALANVLPEIEVVSGCPFNCNPKNPLEMCDNCFSKWSNGESLKVVKVRMRVVDLPLSVTPDMLVGTLDIEKALREGVKALKPGILARANRNILYIDEVNLLDDYVADLILDAAAYGWNIIEREHISFRHPSRFILIGSMNPEEGELRPQLLDRFGLVVNVEAPSDPELRAEIVSRVEEFVNDPISFQRKWSIRERELTERIARARELLPKVVVDNELLKSLAKELIEKGIRTCRAEITVVRTAKALAALDGRLKVSDEDLEEAKRLALPHRLRLNPPPPPRAGGLTRPGTHEAVRGGFEGPANALRDWIKEGLRQEGSGRGRGLRLRVKPLSDKVEIKDLGRGKSLSSLRRKSWFGGSRFKYRTVINSCEGVPIGYIRGWGLNVRDVDVVGTVATLHSHGFKNLTSVNPELLSEVIAVRLRRRRVPELIELVLDASGSMNVGFRIAVAKRVALEVAESSYTRRAWISLIVFRGVKAWTEVPPTRNYSRVINSLINLESGGSTPLPAGLNEALRLARTFKSNHKLGEVSLILITDGKANRFLWRGLREDIALLSTMLKREGVKVMVYDVGGPSVTPSATYIPLIAEVTGAPVIRF